MTISFGTDGWRAVISEDFTFANVRLVAQAIAEKTLDPVWRGDMTAAEATKILCDKIDPILATP